jgi:hypothetical protein
MTHSASSPESSKNLAALALALAVFAFAPGIALAQHGGGGGHAGGGGFGGGHTGGSGFGGSHSSAPSHSGSSHSAPAATSRPANHPSSITTPVNGGASGNAVIHAPNFGVPASTNASGSTAFAFHSQPAAPRTTVIGFPPADSHVAPVTPALRDGSGALSFSGQGHEIWQDAPARGSVNAVTAARPSPSERTLFGRSPSVIARPYQPPRVIYYQPFFFGSGFGFFGPFGAFGNGFCDPFWGVDPVFGCGGLGYGGGFGYGFGYGYGYGNYFGSSYDNSFSVGSTSGPMDYQNDTPSNGYGTYSPAPTPAEGTDQQSVSAAPPTATVIYFKDGTSHEVLSYWLDAGKLHYITNYGGETTVDMGQLDLQRTVDENTRLGVDFTLRPNPPAAPATQSAPPQQ